MSSAPCADPAPCLCEGSGVQTEGVYQFPCPSCGWCTDCEEHHPRGCPLEEPCQGCGFQMCRCDDGFEMDEEKAEAHQGKE